MGIKNKMFRYFIGNPAKIFSVRIAPRFHWRRIPCNTGNSGGFYWLWFIVQWRKPYASCWAYDPIAKRWEIPNSLPERGQPLQ